MEKHYLIIQNSESWINKIPGKSLLIESLEAVVRFFLIFTPVFLLFYGDGGIRDILIGMLIMLPFQLSIVVLKHKTKNGFRFLTYNFLLIICIFMFFSSLEEKIVYTIIQLFTVFYYVKKLKAKSTYYLNLSSLIFTMLPYIFYYGLATMTTLPESISIVTIAAIINIITILVYLQIISKSAVLAWEDNNSGKIREGMNKNSGAIIFLVIFTMLFFNVILWLSGAFDVADSLFNFIPNNTINYNMDNFLNPKKNNNDQVELDTAQKIQELLEAEQKDSKILMYIGYILKVTLIAIVTVVLIYLLYALVIEGKEALKDLLGYKKNTKEKRESVLKESDIAKVIPNTINRVKGKFKESTDLSNNVKIRRLYKKLVKSYKKLGVIPEKYHTAKVISENMESVSSKDYSLLTHIYYKARYGAQQCGEEDVKRAKENM